MKRSTLTVLGLPKEFGVILLVFALILTISPYLGGVDLGIFKVPKFTGNLTWVLYFLGPILLLLFCLLFLPYWKDNAKAPSSSIRSVDTGSKYRLQNITEIIKVEAANHGLNIDGLQMSDRFHINDLKRICMKILFPEKQPSEVSDILQNARATAFSRKYAEPKEDEKLVDVSRIRVDGLKPWHTYFTDILHHLGIDDPNQLDILDVGIGNGHAEGSFLSQIHSFKAVDISDEALEYAKKKYPYPQMTSFICPAEDLERIPNNSVDLYLSLRTYQSTLFDRRTAIHEAYRVLRMGGIILLSIPIMFLHGECEVLSGLIPPGSSEPNMRYAQQLVARIHDYLTILNFRDVMTHEGSPFEIFLSARL